MKKQNKSYLDRIKIILIELFFRIIYIYNISRCCRSTGRILRKSLTLPPWTSRRRQRRANYVYVYLHAVLLVLYQSISVYDVKYAASRFVPRYFLHGYIAFRKQRHCRLWSNSAHLISCTILPSYSTIFLEEQSIKLN